VSEQFLGQIIAVPFNFAPKGWAFCSGQLLPISQNQAIFALLGTTYGGNGTTTFQLPNLQSRVPMHQGNSHVIGEVGGTEAVTLTSAQIAAHGHQVSQPASKDEETTNRPDGAYFTRGGSYAGSADTSLGGTTTSSVGGNQAHENRQPFLALNFVIALTGVFPSRN
jgi:microcystin-dependent protein